MVTVNYRLGALGFAAFPLLTQQDGSSGNYGLLDQQLALKFVSQVGDNLIKGWVPQALSCVSCSMCRC